MTENGDAKAEAEEEKKETVSRPFDPERDGKSWDSIDLASMMTKNNKKRGIKEGKQKIILV